MPRATSVQYASASEVACDAAARSRVTRARLRAGYMACARGGVAAGSTVARYALRMRVDDGVIALRAR